MSRLASSTTSSSTAASKPQRPRMYNEARENSSDTEPGKGGSRLASPEACVCACECTPTGGVGVVGTWTCGSGCLWLRLHRLRFCWHICQRYGCAHPLDRRAATELQHCLAQAMHVTQRPLERK